MCSAAGGGAAAAAAAALAKVKTEMNVRTQATLSSDGPRRLLPSAIFISNLIIRKIEAAARRDRSPRRGMGRWR